MPDATGFRENGNAASPLHFAAHHCKTAVRSPTPSPKPPQAAGPCSWACRRLRPPSPQPNRNAAHPPPARGVGVRRIRANGAGRRHCHPPARGAGVLFSVRHPGARGKEGAVPCDAALPAGARGAAGVRGRRCLPLRGKSASELARRIWAGSWERAFCGALCPSGGLSRRVGERSCRAFRGEHLRRAVEAGFLPFPSPPHSPAIPQGERRALPAPAQGINPLRIPFWGTAAVSPSPPSPTPQAAGPCSWACRRLLVSPPQPNRNAERPPPARGAGARRSRAEGYWPAALPP